MLNSKNPIAETLVKIKDVFSEQFYTFLIGMVVALFCFLCFFEGNIRIVAVCFLAFLTSVGLAAFIFSGKASDKEETPKPGIVSEDGLSNSSTVESFYIGIDIGAGIIDSCILDYNSFKKTKDFSAWRKFEVYDGYEDTCSHDIDEICDQTMQIIKSLVEKFAGESKEKICGIGIGLPGMVEPRKGTLLNSPSLGLVNHVDFVDRLRSRMKGEDFIGHFILDKEGHIPIRIDNDVRCATRYTMKSPDGRNNMLCIFFGNGLGSGIVLNGEMVYGDHFFAGEIGHTTMSLEAKDIPIAKCHCAQEKDGQHHWEAIVCKYGILYIAEHFDKKQYDKFRKCHLKEKKELTVEVLSEAYYNKDLYAIKIAQIFLKYTAIGVANYINILNPVKVILGGGMIQAFANNTKKDPIFGLKGEELITRMVKESVLPSLTFELVINVKEKRDLACLGAALIFEDESYSKYYNS